MSFLDRFEVRVNWLGTLFTYRLVYDISIIHTGEILWVIRFLANYLCGVCQKFVGYFFYVVDCWFRRMFWWSSGSSSFPRSATFFRLENVLAHFALGFMLYPVKHSKSYTLVFFVLLVSPFLRVQNTATGMTEVGGMNAFFISYDIKVKCIL